MNLMSAMNTSLMGIESKVIIAKSIALMVVATIIIIVKIWIVVFIIVFLWGARVSAAIGMLKIIHM
jgi:hypothetical protein